MLRRCPYGRDEVVYPAGERRDGASRDVDYGPVSAYLYGRADRDAGEQAGALLQPVLPVKRTPFTRKPSWKPMNRGKGMSTRRNPLPAVSSGRERLDATVKRRRINPVSKRRQKVNREYARARRSYLADRPRCEAARGGCTGLSTDIHHVRSRGRSGRDSDLVDRANFLACCRNCHDWIESNRREAVELGLLKHGFQKVGE